MWILMLNDMRSPKFEMRQPVARAETREQLQAFVESERVPQWRDTGERVVVHDTDALAQAVGETVREVQPRYNWAKSFRQGGPLEWYNPPYDDQFINVGTEDMWAQNAIEDFRRQVLSIPEV